MATVAGELVVLPLAPVAVAILAQIHVHVADVQLHFVKSRDCKKANRYLPAASKN